MILKALNERDEVIRRETIQAMSAEALANAYVELAALRAQLASARKALEDIESRYDETTLAAQIARAALKEIA